MSNLIPVPKYQPLNPYHKEFDNMPISVIETNLQILDGVLDRVSNELNNSVGTAGSLAKRLNKSLQGSGDLKVVSIDDAMHSIAAHEDGSGYVRMTDAERAKLSAIQDGATDLNIVIQATPSTTISWPEMDQTISFANSDTIEWRYDSGLVYADTAFNKNLIVIHHYDITPNKVSGANYRTSVSNTEYKANSLRVYINGMRLTTDASIDGFYYEESDPSNGTFSLNTPISNGDVIRIDFDQPI